MFISDRSINYKDFFWSVQYYKQELERMGVRSGMRVLMMHNNPKTFLLLFLGLWSLRCTIIPLDEDTPENELNRVFDSCDCHYAISGAPHEDFVENIVENDKLYIHRFKKSEPQEYTDSAVMFYTSGTTGASKCVVFSDQAMVSNIQGHWSCVGINS